MKRISVKKILAVTAMLISLGSLAIAAVSIVDGKKVKFDYTLTVDEKVIESSEGKEPLEYTQGEHQVIPGLEKALAGMQVGQQKSVTIPPADAYGEVNKDAFRDFPKSSFPQDLKPEAGMIVQLEGPQGQKIPAVVWEMKDDKVILNFNHPLAGKTLKFDVKIVSIE